MNFDSFLTFVEEKGWQKKLSVLENVFVEIKNHGDYEKFVNVLNSLPSTIPSFVDLNSAAVKIGKAEDLQPEEQRALKDLLRKLIPWRKGPFEIFEIFIDSEWRSDFKWDRLKDDISTLQGKDILDVGSGNGYHCWRMLGAGASSVTGIDPYLLSVVQFNAVKSFMKDLPVWVLPVAAEQMPANLELFDVVFSMGVLYHRRSPFDHLLELKSFLKPGGELILETLTIDADENSVLVPQGRYAKMRNVWFIPSVITLEKWLERAGFKNVRLVNVSQTTTKEQRRTEWMPWESFEDFLNPNNKNETIEGYPAPLRAIFVCEK